MASEFGSRCSGRGESHEIEEGYKPTLSPALEPRRKTDGVLLIEERL